MVRIGPRADVDNFSLSSPLNNLRTQLLLLPSRSSSHKVLVEASFAHHRNRNIHLVRWLEALLYHDTITWAMFFDQRLSNSLISVGVISGVSRSISTFGSRSCINSGEAEEAVLIVIVSLACPEGLSVVAFTFPAKHEVSGWMLFRFVFPMVGGENEMFKYYEFRFFTLQNEQKHSESFRLSRGTSMFKVFVRR